MDAGLRPLAGLPPLVSLFLISLVSALLILMVMRHVSNQAGLSRSKRGMQASLLEIRLFKDDLRAVMSALRDGLRHNARYLMLSLVPLAWVAVPLSLIVVHLQAYYGYAGLTPAPCRLVAAPRVAEAHAALECKVVDGFHPKGVDGTPAKAFVMIGEVVGVHIDDAMLTQDGLFDMVKAGNLARLGYFDYLSIEQTFQMRRPRWKDG